MRRFKFFSTASNQMMVDLDGKGPKQITRRLKMYTFEHEDHIVFDGEEIGFKMNLRKDAVFVGSRQFYKGESRKILSALHEIYGSLPDSTKH